MDRLKNILVGVDFSLSSRFALAQAARLSHKEGATLHVLHVLEDLVVRDLSTALSQEKIALENELKMEFHEELKRFVLEVVPLEGIHLEIRVGNPLDVFLHRVNELQADLLVMGVTGSTGERTDLGTLALRCVRKANTKVLLVRPPITEPFRKVVGCVDFSDLSKRVVVQAARSAKVEKASLELAHVFSPPWKKLHYMAPTPQATPDFQDQFRRGLDLQMKKLIEECSEEIGSIEVKKSLIEHSDYSQGLIDHINVIGADLIVLGTKGRSNISYMLMGSTAEKVLQATPCSVLAIKPSDFSFDIG